MEELEVGGEGDSDDGEMAVVPVRDDADCCFRAHSGVWCNSVPFCITTVSILLLSLHASVVVAMSILIFRSILSHPGSILSHPGSILSHPGSILSHPGSVFSVSLHPSCELACSGGEDDKAFVWRVADGAVVFECQG